MADPQRPAAVQASTTGLAAAPIQAIPNEERPPRPPIPERYALREKDGARFLECDEAPRVRAIIDPQMSVTRSTAASLGERVILLDGAGNFGPMIDNEKKLYNLDHHAGCERLFTLATCEQALLLVQSGLELSDGDWTIYANDPDLDTVLALWCLLNYRRVRELSPEARDVLLPLFRLEGAIDANGPKLAALCGLPTALIQRTWKRIEFLLARERELKQTGSWAKKKLYPYTLEMLCAVDALVYAREDFGDYTRIDEVYGHVEVAPRRVAVACRDNDGIYTVEQHLKTRWGDQLSLIALENEPGQYTLRRVSTLAGPQLGPAYELLNRVDRAVDGRPASKQWGGSQDIGGSPRPTGTLLAPDELLSLLERTYRPTTWWTRTRKTCNAMLLGLSCLLFWPLSSLFPSLAPSLGGGPGVTSGYALGVAALLTLAVGMLVTRFGSHRRPWVFGWRAPANGGGWWLSPVALVGALPVALWASGWLDAAPLELGAVLAGGALAIAAGELWFRGVVHGLLVTDFPVQRPRGRWLLSRAALASSAAYAVVATLLADAALRSPLLVAVRATELELVAGTATLAFAAGLALAVIRERSLSLVPGIAIQVVGLVAAVALGSFVI